MEDLYITMAISIILAKVKDEKFKTKFKAALLKVRNAINAAFPDDL